jgi:hypothetical protein
MCRYGIPLTGTSECNLPQELLLAEHVGGALIARLPEEQAVHERAGHLAPAPLQLRHAVLHLGGQHPHPLSCQLGLIQQAAHPAHPCGQGVADPDPNPYVFGTNLSGSGPR